MQTLTEKVYKLAPPGGLFDKTVVRNLFPDLSSGARKILVFRAVNRGEVWRLKPGVYSLTDEYRKSAPHPFVVAGVLHAPSHISLESALAYHGLIPEAVYQVTSVTSRRGRIFRTPLGTFSFQRVPALNPSSGVKAVRIGEQGWAFIASPVRAIADLVYLRKGVFWNRDGLDFLTDSLRIEEEELKKIRFKDYNEIHESIRSRRTRDYLAGLREALER
jgi:hypothetical protein